MWMLHLIKVLRFGLKQKMASALVYIKLPMQEQLSQDFQDYMKQLIPFITLQNTQNYLNKMSEQSHRSLSQSQSHHIFIHPQKIHTFNFQAAMMTNCQTQECFMFAFCLVDKQTSSIVLRQFRKKIQTMHEQQLKSINVAVSAMAFKFNKYKELQLILGTKCGRIFIYRNFQNLQINVSSFRISACSIHQVLPTTLENTIFVLQESGIIYIVDISDELIKLQLQCLQPRIKGSQMKLLADLNYKYIWCCFSYGRIMTWDIKDHITSVVNLVCSQHQTHLDQEQKIAVDKKVAKKQGKQAAKKNVLLKPKSLFLPCVLQGIYWIDLLGEFFMVLTKSGILKIVAISNQEKTQSLELYKVINQLKVSESCEPSEKQNYEEKIVGVQKLQNQCVFIAKQKQIMLSGRRQNIVFQRYEIRDKFSICKTLTIILCLNSSLKQVIVSQNQQHIVCRTTKGVSIFKIFDSKEKK